jgi:hypothetical protein
MNRSLLTALPLISLALVACLGAPESTDDESDGVPVGSNDDGAARAPRPVRLPSRTAIASRLAEAGPLRDVSNLSASVATQGGVMKYHGGPVMTAAPKVYVIWYGDWADNTATTILPDFLSHLGGSPWFNINTTYGDATNFVQSSLTYAGSTNDSYSQGSSLSDAEVQTVVSTAIGNGSLPGDANAIYLVLASADVGETSGFCTQYCGWHDHGTISGKDIKYAFIGNPDRCPTSCEWQSTSPNGNAGADGMASIIAHEIAETVTDPDLNAWYDSTGYENADKCAWTFGTMYKVGTAEANVHLGTRDYLLQRNWLNVGAGKCALSHSSPPPPPPPPSASDVTVSGTPFTTATLTGSYTFTDPSGAAESGSTYQWYRGTTAIAGATGLTYTVMGADTNATLKFCVTPADANGTGAQACSSAVTVPGVTWFTGASQTGSATPVSSTQGACVAMSSIGAVGSFNSLRLDGQPSTISVISMYTSADCTGAVWTRQTGINNVHNIDLATVGIGNAIRSYRITW